MPQASRLASGQARLRLRREEEEGDNEDNEAAPVEKEYTGLSTVNKEWQKVQAFVMLVAVLIVILLTDERGH